jgi:glutamate dehydrogenase/leucine dehydrogenase
MALLGVETMGWSEAEVTAHVSESVDHMLRETFEMAAAQQITTNAAARSVAEGRLR